MNVKKHIPIVPTLADTLTRFSSRTLQSTLKLTVFIVGSPWSGTAVRYDMLPFSEDSVVYLRESKGFDLAFLQFGDFGAWRNRLGDQIEPFLQERSEFRRIRPSRSVENDIPAWRSPGATEIDRTDSSKTRPDRKRSQPFERSSYALEGNADNFPHLLECEAMVQDENLLGRFFVRPGSPDL